MFDSKLCSIVVVCLIVRYVLDSKEIQPFNLVKFKACNSQGNESISSYKGQIDNYKVSSISNSAEV